MTITGESRSRLNELEKYVVTDNFNDKYIGNGSINVDGVDYNSTIPLINIIYFIGGIRYADQYLNGEYQKTTFRLESQEINDLNFIDKPYYKDPNMGEIISSPKIDDDVFIIRQELSAFDDIYRFEFINNLSELESYASGGYFNIINNNTV